MNEAAKEIQFKEEEEMELDLLELIAYLKSKWIWLVCALLVGAAIAGVITYFCITPKYKATTKLYMVSASNDSVIDLTDLNLGTSLSSDYVEMIKIRPIFEDVIEEEKLPYTYEELLEMTSIETVTDTRILNITVESKNPKEAQVTANALAKKAVTYLPKLMETSAPNIAEEAIFPQKKSSPSLTKNTMLGGVAVLGIVLVVFIFMFVTDDTLKNAEDVEKAFGVLPLTVIPEGVFENKQDQKGGKN